MVDSDTPTSNITVITAKCLMCGLSSQITMPLDKYQRWYSGESIQVVMPEWSAEERELLISGTHGPCWNEMMHEFDEPESVVENTQDAPPF